MAPGETWKEALESMTVGRKYKVIGIERQDALEAWSACFHIKLPTDNDYTKANITGDRRVQDIIASFQTNVWILTRAS